MPVRAPRLRLPGCDCTIAISLTISLICAAAHATPLGEPRGGHSARKHSPPPALRTLVARQAALDRAGFSPGPIDGRGGTQTTQALREFQASRGLPRSAKFDPATLAALQAGNATTEYMVTAADLKSIGPVPRDWTARSKRSRLGYESLAALLAERGHCTRALVARLNPGRNLARLRPGDRVLLPDVGVHAAHAARNRSAAAADLDIAGPPLPSAARLEVNLRAKTILARDARGQAVAFFHCSIARLAAKRPRGAAHVTAVAFNPVYRFDPKMWPEVHNVHRVLIIPPGPRNPVGLCWIDLNLPGYGIHGTPNPELIGKTGSHGCIRLANWDAVRLGRMVRRGTVVEFLG